MSLATYAGLQTTIANTLMRQDLTSYIPDWITMCEASIRRLLKSQQEIIRAYVEGNPGDVDRYKTLPGDFYELVDTPRINAANGVSQPIEYITPRLMDELWQSPESAGSPRFFTIVGPQIQFFPAPNGEQIEIAYRRGVEALATAAGGVNALLLEAPDIYLYGSLIHSATFLREDERIGTWTKLYTDAMADFNLAHLRKRFSGAPLIARPRRTIG